MRFVRSFFLFLAIWVLFATLASAQTPLNPAQINFGSQVQISTTGTGEYGGRLAAADAKYNLRPATFVVRQDGTVSSATTLQSGHSLRVTAQLTLAATVTLGSNSVVECSGHGALVLAGGGFFVQHGATNVTVRNCPGSGTGGATVVSVSEGSHLQVHGLQFLGADLVSVASGGFDDLTINNNTAVNCPAQCIFISGNVTHIGVHGGHFSGVHGVEMFGIDAKTNPTLAQILAGGPSQFSVTGVTCGYVAGSCVWGSGWHDGVVSNNVANGCGDTCFDTEGSANVDFDSNDATGAANFDYSTFYSTFNVRFHNNRAHEQTAEMFRIKYTGGIGAYGSNDVLVDENWFVCDSTTAPCTAMVLEGNLRTSVVRNHFLNAQLGDIGNAAVAFTFSGNELKFTLPLTSPAVQIPTSLSGTITEIEDNKIVSYVAQDPSLAAIRVDSADYNANDQYYLFRNTIVGFGLGLQLLNNGGNQGVPALFWLRDNALPGNQPATTPMVVTGGNSPVQIFKNGNNCNIINACY